MTEALLNTAIKHPTVKSVVLTSSRAVAYFPTLNGPDVHATTDDWTDWALDSAKGLSPDHPAAGFMVRESFSLRFS